GDLQRCLIVCPGSLAEQWQDEMNQRFHLPFEILTNDRLEASRTGNWFLEADQIIARLDKLARDDELQQKLAAPDCRWDLVVCDEAHKMSATFFGGEVSYTKRFQLGRVLSTLTRHFLLMTATPHNGKEEDFQLFMSLLDGDRFEGKFRDGVHTSDASDLMRRMVKEQLLKFDGRPLFPERIAKTVPFKLSEAEAELYAEVTSYVREEFSRAEALQNDKRAGTVGFALTILQRRLASSPEAIYQSLLRRRERLESKLKELELIQRGFAVGEGLGGGRSLDPDDLEDLEEAPDSEVEQAEEEVLDQATAARTIVELRAEIVTLRHLEALAGMVRRSGNDTKWKQLAGLLSELLSGAPGSTDAADKEPRPKPSPRQKIVIFTEHRDTLNYLRLRITTLLGREDAVVTIHGGMGREERLSNQEAFKFQPEVQVLVATDAAGEGINLQRAHLMVNYDLPWNPNRLEQRFGRIHRIGQTEVCFLWNLVATETREGDVYHRLLEKLDEARKALGGQVFDVLGKLEFEGKSLRELLIQAVREGERPEVRERLNRVVENAVDRRKLQGLLEEHALVHDSMDVSRVRKIREDMERAEARRLQPHFIESFFIEAFSRLGGTMRQREPRRYEITHVPAIVRSRDRLIGTREAVLSHYERATFEKDLIAPPGQPLATFVCPGSPLLDSVIDLTLERNRDLLKRGTVLVDEGDSSTEPRIFFYIESPIQDASTTRSGERRVVSKRVFHIEMDARGRTQGHPPRPLPRLPALAEGDPCIEAILARPECAWISRELEGSAQSYAIMHIVPEHVEEVKTGRLERIAKTEAAVKDRLGKEINYWDHRAEELKAQEQAGKPNARLNSMGARKRADLLQGRLQKRIEELKLEAQIAPLPPVILGGFVVVPVGLVRAMKGEEPVVAADSALLPIIHVSAETPASAAADKQAAAARARAIVMEVERSLGFEPVDRETEKVGYDIESRVPGTGKLRFIEVKGRVAGAQTLTVTHNEIRFSLNKPEDFILAIVEFVEGGEGGAHRMHYLREPFAREPDFDVASVNYYYAQLLARAGKPS
ncbi:MAG TPA: helicase-related protein, partial [Spirochaetia bacterium]|nr:helicase-related protein [Spirochaetia bacterium]